MFWNRLKENLCLIRNKIESFFPIRLLTHHAKIRRLAMIEQESEVRALKNKEIEQEGELWGEDVGMISESEKNKRFLEKNQ